MIPDRSEELSLSLDDWGVTITHLAVTATFDPDTQTVSEISTSTELLAFLGPVESTALTSRPGQLRRQLRTILVRFTDWPEIAAGSARRVVLEDKTYDVIETTSSEVAGWVRVIGLQRDGFTE